jgi:type II secretory pathway component GspD/PulD (secretin)/tetratricopeptide (TPR) repeat protein
MTKAAILTLASSVFLATAPVAWSQAPAEDTAVNEAVYRQANRITLRQKLAEAKAAQERHALPSAAKLYDEAWELVQKIGSGVDAEREQTIAGLAAVRLELARDAQRHEDYIGAATQVRDVLRVDPSNAAALEFQRANDKLLAEQRGKIPDAETQAQVPAIIQEKITSDTLTQDGKLLYELGKYDEAEVKLKQALRLDPNSQSALYYLSLCADGKYTQATKRRAVTAQQNLTEVVQDWANPVKRELLPVPNPYARTNLINTSPGRQTLMSKLDRIRLDSVKYDGLPLSEVIINLNDEAKKRDPEKRGLNFLISQTADTGGPTAAAAPQIGPDGQPLPVAPTEAADIGADQIKINPALTDVRLIDVLDAIIKVAGPTPIKYSIEDYAVIFSLKGRDVNPLYVRTFKVDPNTFYQGLQGVGGLIFGASANVGQNTGGSFGGGGGGGGGGGAGNQGNSIAGAIISRVNVSPGGVIGGNQGGGASQLQQGGQGGQGAGGVNFVTRTNDMAQVSEAARNYFQALGVDLDPIRNPGKALFFNDRLGQIIVRATMQDLDIIEAAIQVLNIVPPQVTIKAKFVEVSQDDNKALGFDWYLGNWLMNNNSIGAQAGTAPSFLGAPTPANPTGLFPGNAAAGTAITPKSTDQLLTSGLRNIPTTLFTVTGILTDPQFRMVVHAIENRTGADVLAAPEVTTISGRQAEMKATDIQTIVTGFSFSQNNAASGNTAGGIGTTTLQVSTAFVFPLPEQLELGPTLDVIPSVLADGYTVNLVLIPTLTEFVGYQDASQFNQALPASAGAFPGGLVTVPTVLPLFRVRQVVSTVNVWDGQTVVLGGLISENVATTKDKIPMLGDMPVVGRFFRSESKMTAKKNLLIFTTPTLIDPAGNRLHTEDEMPFAQTQIPVQPPVTGVATNSAPHVQ